MLLLQERLRIKRADGAEVIGSTTAAIDGSRASCRDEECQYGNLLCDELLRYGREKYGTQIALYNGGGIRASLPAGDITAGHIKEVHPFGNKATFFTLKGAAITQMLEDVLSEHGAPPGTSGNYLQTSGLRFQASLSGSAWTTHNTLVKNISTGAWDDLDADKSYSVVSNTYIVDGNGGRKVASGNLVMIDENGPAIADLMTDLFRRSSPVSPPALDGRSFHQVSSKVLGTATDTIDGSKASCRDHTCAYGVLLCDEMLRMGQESGYGTQIALYNGGGIRASLPKGDVDVAAMLAIHPYGNLMSYFKLQGQFVKKYLDMALEEHGPPGQGAEGNWPQLAGLRFMADWDGSAWTLKDVQVQSSSSSWEPLDVDAMYSMTTNAYVRYGNGGRDVVSTHAVPLQDDGPAILGMMETLIARSSPVSPPKYDARECLDSACASSFK